MRYIAHRINTVRELAAVPAGYGVEVDLRDRGDRIVLQHDPFRDGEDLEDYLAHYRHGTLILNIKSERIEHRALELLHRHRIEDFFFLDSSFSMIHALSLGGETRVALRFSEFEGLDTLMAMRGRARWVWVDCFTRLPLDRTSHDLLRGAGYLLCLASPDLLGRPEELPRYRRDLEDRGIGVDAVCAKIGNLGQWR